MKVKEIRLTLNKISDWDLATFVARKQNIAVSLFTKNNERLGTIDPSGEFYPTDYYDNNPHITDNL